MTRAAAASRPTLVLIPAHDEAERIGAVVDGIRQSGACAPPWHADVLVVDDGSRDATHEVAERHGAHVLRHVQNLGYGSALHTGYLWAWRHGYERIVQMDADGQHDPRSLLPLLRALEGIEGTPADVVVGSRYLHGTPPPTSFARRAGSWFFSRVVTLWTGIRITDPTSGYQALSRRALGQLVGDAFPEDYPDADVLIELARAGLRLREIPVVMHARAGGVSMHRGGKIAYYLYKMLLTLTLLPLRRRSIHRRGRRPQTA
jgi:glycosyltransferase involved in cell wall biosynthesis